VGIVVFPETILMARILFAPAFAGALFCLSFLSACSGNKTDSLLFDTLNENLLKSNVTISRSTDLILSELEEKAKDPATAYKGQIWGSKAKLVKELSAGMFGYIEKLKARLIKEAGGKEGEVDKSYHADDMYATERLFRKKNEEKQLIAELIKYNEALMAIDPGIKSAFDSSVIGSFFYKYPNGKKRYATELLLEEISVFSALSLLNGFQNNIVVFENRLIQFCDNKVSSAILWFDSYSAIIAQSSSYIKAGEKFEITAGVGAFSSKSMPVITINGVQASLSEDGAAHYIFKASTKPGKHAVKVKINFTDEIGQKQTIEKAVVYTVAE
jgi:hypothetical protein